jgi:hypothetical protein
VSERSCSWFRQASFVCCLTVSSVILIDDPGAHIDAVLPRQSTAGRHSSVDSLRQGDGQVRRAETLAASRDHHILGAGQVVTGRTNTAANGNDRERGQPATGAIREAESAACVEFTSDVCVRSCCSWTHFLTSSLIVEDMMGDG